MARSVPPRDASQPGAADHPLLPLAIVATHVPPACIAMPPLMSGRSVGRSPFPGSENQSVVGESEASNQRPAALPSFPTAFPGHTTTSVAPLVSTIPTALARAGTICLEAEGLPLSSKRVAVSGPFSHPP